MRQAGRYLPEYNKIRANMANFLDLCYDSDKASTVTLQPINRFGFDAAIIFSDILVILDSLGWTVEFKKEEGPVLRQFKSDEDLGLLAKKLDSKINNIYDTVSKVKAKLPESCSLIGFAGSPWTVISYMLEGRGKQNFSVSKSFLYNKKDTALKLTDYIAGQTVEYLSGQITAGADIIQLFDSWAGMLSRDEYQQFVIGPTKKIITELKNRHSNIPVIGFPRGSGFLYDQYINETGIDAIGVDQFVPVEIMAEWQNRVTIQGNLDPVVLLSNKDQIAMKAEEILAGVQSKNFIFNLGHGILPATPIENVEFLVNYVRKYQR